MFTKVKLPLNHIFEWFTGYYTVFRLREGLGPHLASPRGAQIFQEGAFPASTKVCLLRSVQGLRSSPSGKSSAKYLSAGEKFRTLPAKNAQGV